MCPAVFFCRNDSANGILHVWPTANIAPLCDNMFPYFLCHPYILITFVENFIVL